MLITDSCVLCLTNLVYLNIQNNTTITKEGLSSLMGLKLLWKNDFLSWQHGLVHNLYQDFEFELRYMLMDLPDFDENFIP